MIRHALVISLVLAAGKASALSCSFSDAAGAYNDAQSLGNDFVAVVGQLDWEPFGPYPEHNGIAMEFEGQDHVVDGRFNGEVLNESGVRTTFDGPVSIQAACINGDCGYAYRDAPMLSFIHTVDGASVMYTYPCQSYPRTVTPEGIAQIQACVDGGDCTGTWTQ